jgi:hypothetical protein
MMRPIRAPARTGTATRTARVVALLAVVIASGCARAIEISTDPAAASAIEVTNQTGTTMIVEYQAGAARATLGAVTPGGTERFIITLPTGTSISVTARNDAGTRTSGPYSVTLQAGETQLITLR